MPFIAKPVSLGLRLVYIMLSRLAHDLVKKTRGLSQKACTYIFENLDVLQEKSLILIRVKCAQYAF